MPATIPFSDETFRPICPLNNDKSEQPVEFDICAVGGPSRARLKSIILATTGLASTTGWTPEVQESVIKAFETGAAVFADGITAIRGLSAPAGLLRKVGLIQELPKGVSVQSQIPITNGFEYSRVCGYWPILSFEVACAIARISGQAEVDPRFFAWLSTSLKTPTIAPGVVESAASSNSGSAIAAKRRTARRRTSTSRRAR
jgi:hypothetical protein